MQRAWNQPSPAPAGSPHGPPTNAPTNLRLDTSITNASIQERNATVLPTPPSSASLPFVYHRIEASPVYGSPGAYLQSPPDSRAGMRGRQSSLPDVSLPTSLSRHVPPQEPAYPPVVASGRLPQAQHQQAQQRPQVSHQYVPQLQQSQPQRQQHQQQALPFQQMQKSQQQQYQHSPSLARHAPPSNPQPNDLQSQGRQPDQAGNRPQQYLPYPQPHPQASHPRHPYSTQLDSHAPHAPRPHHQSVPHPQPPQTNGTPAQHPHGPANPHPDPRARELDHLTRARHFTQPLRAYVAQLLDQALTASEQSLAGLFERISVNALAREQALLHELRAARREIAGARGAADRRRGQLGTLHAHFVRAQEEATAAAAERGALRAENWRLHQAIATLVLTERADADAEEETGLEQDALVASVLAKVHAEQRRRREAVQEVAFLNGVLREIGPSDDSPLVLSAAPGEPTAQVLEKSAQTLFDTLAAYARKTLPTPPAEDPPPMASLAPPRPEEAGHPGSASAAANESHAVAGTATPKHQHPSWPSPMSDVIDLTKIADSPVQTTSAVPLPAPQVDTEPTKKRERTATELADHLVKRRRTSEVLEGEDRGRSPPLETPSSDAPAAPLSAPSAEGAQAAASPAVEMVDPSDVPQWTALVPADETPTEPDESQSCNMGSVEHRNTELGLPEGADEVEEVKEEAWDADGGVLVPAEAAEDKADIKQEVGVSPPVDTQRVPPTPVPLSLGENSLFVVQRATPTALPPHVPRKLGMRHLPLMYETQGNKMICRMCLSRKEKIDVNLGVVSYPEDASWKDLVNHCETAHPRGFEMLVNMGSDEIEEAKIKWKR